MYDKTSNFHLQQNLDRKVSKDEFLQAALSGRVQDLNKIQEYCEQNRHNPDALNVTDAQGGTALIIASRYSKQQTIDILVKYNANCEKKDNHGNTALFYASRNGKIKIVAALLSHPNIRNSINATLPHGQTPLIIASYNGYETIVRLLIAQGATDLPTQFGETALNSAINRRNFNIVTILRRSFQYGFRRTLNTSQNSQPETKESFHTPFKQRLSKINFSGSISKEFLCPLSQEIMDEPITLWSGQTCDRTSLEDIFKRKNYPHQMTNPMGQGTIDLAELDRGSTLTIKQKIEGFLKEQEALYANQTQNSPLAEAKPVEENPPKRLAFFSYTVQSSTRSLGNFEERLNKINCTEPFEFKCPLLQGVILDPITVATGQTYDRNALKGYFASHGNPPLLKCPMTKEWIQIEELSRGTNITIKQWIEDFISSQEQIYSVAP